MEGDIPAFSAFFVVVSILSTLFATLGGSYLAWGKKRREDVETTVRIALQSEKRHTEHQQSIEILRIQLNGLQGKVDDMKRSIEGISQDNHRLLQTTTETNRSVIQTLSALVKKLGIDGIDSSKGGQ